ncbi:MAG TPA: LLM class F420-dependent oxidoreductase [Alphaproteobacteria bacterium]|jgi:F420-dependent oxidoreductase-like protein|nr:LLM class F420-dependent oxidoreductase [Alphaproteobacteria bacterium]
MKIGLQIPNFTWGTGPGRIGGTLADIARAAEMAGFASIWVMDHFFQIPPVGPPETDMLEGYSALSYLAAVTSKVKLGTMATGVVYRHPGILVKTATTVDVLSGGRAYLGIGAAWFEREALGLGTPFPPLSDRFEMLEEALRIAKQMWSNDDGAYKGKHYHLAETLCVPQPLSRPHPPILVAGSGEKKTLRLVAQYADACNLFGDATMVAPKLEVLKAHCGRLGRDYAEIEKTTLGTAHLAPGQMTAKDIVAHCRALAAIGVDHALFNMPNVQDITPLEVFGREVIPEVAEL